MLILRVLAAVALLVMVAPNARAHQSSLSFLTLKRSDAGMTGTLRVAFVDIELAVGLDADLDGEVTWRETLDRSDAIWAYALSRVEVATSTACVPALRGLSPVSDASEDYLDLAIALTCADPAGAITARSLLFQELDPQSRTLLRVDDRGDVESRVLGAASGSISGVQMGSQATAVEHHESGFLSYVVEGLAHLFGGPDHMLFLLLLIAPGVQAATGARRMLVAILWPVTGFTLGHALTLTAAASDLIRAPAGVVEAMIALTILLTAIDNVKRFLPGPRTVIAMIFGLVHGLGFASALGALDLTGWPLVVALLGFNLGIEAGQVLIALAVAPLIFLIRKPALRYRLLPQGLSIAAGLMALVWLAERTGFAT